jgi:hypothetical protein
MRQLLIDVSRARAAAVRQAKLHHDRRDAFPRGDARGPAVRPARLERAKRAREFGNMAALRDSAADVNAARSSLAGPSLRKDPSPPGFTARPCWCWRSASASARRCSAS